MHVRVVCGEGKSLLLLFVLILLWFCGEGQEFMYVKGGEEEGESVSGR